MCRGFIRSRLPAVYRRLFVRNLPLIAGYSSLIFTQTLVKDNSDRRLHWSAQASTLYFKTYWNPGMWNLLIYISVHLLLECLDFCASDMSRHLSSVFSLWKYTILRCAETIIIGRGKIFQSSKADILKNPNWKMATIGVILSVKGRIWSLGLSNDTSTSTCIYTWQRLPITPRKLKQIKYHQS